MLPNVEALFHWQITKKMHSVKSHNGRAEPFSLFSLHSTSQSKKVAK